MNDTSHYAAYIGLVAVICVIVLLAVLGVLAALERRAKQDRLKRQRTAALSRYKYNDGGKQR